MNSDAQPCRGACRKRPCGAASERSGVVYVFSESNETSQASSRVRLRQGD